MVIAGNIYSLLSSVAASGYLSILPTGTQEVVIHNIYYAGAVNFYFTDGTNYILFDSDTTAGARNGQYYHCNASLYIQVQNVGSSAILIGCDGMYTQV